MMCLDVPEVDHLINCDRDNVDECKRMLAELSPTVLETINDAAILYTTINRVFAQSISDLDHFGEINRLLDERGFDSDRELIPLADSDESVRDALNRFQDRDLRGALLVRIGVLNLQLFADLFRIRMTAPFAYLRVQVESLALLAIMSKDPAVSVEWSDVGLDDNKGKKFFNKYKVQIGEILEARNLKRVYDMASGVALHSRYSGLALISTFSHRTADGRWERSTEVRTQEFDPDDPLPFLLIVIQALKTQKEILTSLISILPELNDPLLIETRIPKFSAAVSAVIDDVVRAHPRLAAVPSNAA